ncbi:MAG: hypothetical protein AAF483_02975 [Planctomycetota bacterium]
MDDLLIGLFISSFLAVAVLFGFYGIAGRATALGEIGCIAITVVVALVCATGIVALDSGKPLVAYAVCLYMCLIATISAAAPRIVYRSFFGGDQFQVAFLFRLSAYIAVIVALGSSGILQGRDVAESIALRFGLIPLVFVALFYTVFLVARRTTWVLWLAIPLCYIAALGFIAGFEKHRLENIDLFFAPLNFHHPMHFSMWVSMHLYYFLCWA